MVIAIDGAFAQIPTPIGTNHPELDWYEIETEHFRVIYHNGLEPYMQDAAKMSEEAYRVVSTNLGVEIPGKTKIYFSDNDAIKNAFAMMDDHIFVWMRGILDDHPYAVRSSGTSKWLRSVITHEYTHTALAYATKGKLSWLFPNVGVPRWFNEGMARYMEPDGWTADLDMVLRVAAVTGQLDLGGPGYWQGTLLYEAGQSLVRHIATQYGDSALRKIVNHDGGWFYNFEKAVRHATGKSLEDVYTEWQKRVNVYYNTQFGSKIEVEEIGRVIPTGIAIANSVRLSPDGEKLAVIGREDIDSPPLLYIYRSDTSSERTFIEMPAGFDGYFSWGSTSRSIIFPKLRYGENARLLYDLFESRDGRYIVATKTKLTGSDLWLLDREGNEIRQLTNFNDPDISVYWPRFNYASNEVAFSIFDKQGRRDVATIGLNSSEINYITRDSINDRYAVWSPTGDSLVFISYRNGVPNIYRYDRKSGTRNAITDVAGGVTVWDWAKHKDSLLVSSVDDRNHIRIYWVSPSTKVDTQATPHLRQRYTEWRENAWPIVPRPMADLSTVTTTPVDGYSSIAEVKPMLFLPVAGSDKSRSGELGTRYGIVGVAFDPMAKHNFVGFVDYGTASKQLSGSLSYQNNTLRPSLVFNVSSILSYSGMIDHMAYFEREESAALGVLTAWPTANSLTQYFFLLTGADYRRVLPWNREQYLNTVPERRPISADLATLGARFGFVSTDFLTSLTYTHADKAYKSDLTYSRYRFGISYRSPNTPERDAYFAVYGRALANFGDELPQEFIGFSPYDVFEGGVNLAAMPMQDRLRGIRRYVYGNRLAIGSVELRSRDRFFSSIFTPLQSLDPFLTYFFDIGSAWYGSKPTNNPNVTITEIDKLTWFKTAGIELRGELAPGSAISGGVAWELVKRAQPDWYVRTVIEW
jgi:WD40 repeat protein